MFSDSKVALINIVRYGPDPNLFQPESVKCNNLVSDGIQLYSCREAVIETKKLLPGISTRLVDRQSLQAGIAAKQALSVLPEGKKNERAGVVLGSSFGAAASMYDFFHKIQSEGSTAISPMEFPNTVSNAAASRVGMWLALKGHCVSISNGNLSSLDAIGLACREIREGLMDFYLAGGSEEIPQVVRQIYAKVTASDRKHDHSNGISQEILYEGAAMVLLALQEFAAENKLETLGLIDGYLAGTVVKQDSSAVLAEVSQLMEQCGYSKDHTLFCTAIVPGSKLSYATAREAVQKFGEKRVIIHNLDGERLVNYFALDGVMGIAAVLKNIAVKDHPEQDYRQAIIWNIENDGRFSAVAIHV